MLPFFQASYGADRKTIRSFYKKPINVYQINRHDTILPVIHELKRNFWNIYM